MSNRLSEILANKRLEIAALDLAKTNLGYTEIMAPIAAGI